MTKHINEENIRVAAYYIWEQAGRPEGQEKECWIKACEQLFACNNKKAATTRSYAKKPATKSTLKPALKPASKAPKAKSVKAKMPTNKVSAMPLSDLNLKSTNNNLKGKKVFA